MEACILKTTDSILKFGDSYVERRDPGKGIPTSEISVVVFHMELIVYVENEQPLNSERTLI